MTFPCIKQIFDLQYPSKFKIDDGTAIKIITKAVPSLKYLARPSCAAYLEIDVPSSQMDNLSQERIKKHILMQYDFDVIDISHIIKELDIFFMSKET
jgi:hypothetical protein